MPAISESAHLITIAVEMIRLTGQNLEVNIGEERRRTNLHPPIPPEVDEVRDDGVSRTPAPAAK